MHDNHLIYLKNALLIDGTGNASKNNAGLLVKGNVIEQVISTDQEKNSISQKIEVRDLSGFTLMPGLIEMHVHLVFPLRMACGRDSLLWEQLEKAAIRATLSAKALLQAGFTTIRDVGCRGRIAMAVRDAINDGLIQGPRVIASGPILSTTGGQADSYMSWIENNADICIRVDGQEDVRKAVRLLLKDGADNIKLEASGAEVSPFSHSWDATMSYEEILVAVQEARKHGKTVAAHAQGNEGIKNAVRAGVTTVEHATYIDRETAIIMRDNNQFIVPTIGCIFSWLDFAPATGGPDYAVKEMSINKDPWLKGIRMAADLGVKIANGSDLGGRTPQGYHAWELELLVKEVGFSPMEAIVSATKSAAEALQLQEQIGTLESGKLADLLVVEGNPLKNISLLRETDRIRLIMKEGIIFKDTL